MDAVNHPKHYTQQPVEAVEVTENLNFCLGNAVKYVWRFRAKNGKEDLLKAQWYVRRELERSDAHRMALLLPADVADDLAEKLALCCFEPGQGEILGLLVTAAALYGISPYSAQRKLELALYLIEGLCDEYQD